MSDTDESAVAVNGGAASVPSSREEFTVFITIAALIWPVVAVGVVGGFGFLVWMSQIVFGPPGPPG
jgi:nitrate reductase NapE